MSNIIPKTHPSSYGLHHDNWREHQFEALQWLENSESPVRIMEAPTGSGKSATATAFAHKKKAMSLVQTKLLQQSNYKDIYKWDILFGKGNYPCDHPDAERDNTADQCLYADVGMSKCPVASECKYMKQKHKVMFSNKSSLNYAYYLLSKWPKEIPYDLLVMDEAHMLSDITLDHAGISIHERVIQEWGLPFFPIITGNESISVFYKQETPQEKAKAWLSKCLSILNTKYKGLKSSVKMHDKKGQAKLTRCKNLISKISSTIQSMEINDSQWFIQSGPGLISYRGAMLAGLITRPLTARHHFSGLFSSAPISVLMSATIGNVEAFTDELGIEDYDWKVVPSNWHPETRPVYDLQAPRMGYKSGQSDYEKQADVIYQAISECPSDWMGVVHVTRKNEAPLLAERLRKRGLGSRMWYPNGGSTNQQMAEWENFKKLTYGAIGVVYSWTEGVDLFDEKICISAKIPYPPLGDPFEKARQMAYGKFYLQRTAWKFMQSLGRTRRGEKEHYDIDGQKNGLVAIADGNWTRIRKYISQDILDTIVTI